MGSRYRALTGLDRVGTAIKTATSSFAQTANATGDITQGEVVEVTLDGSIPAVGSASIDGAATGAILLGYDAVPPSTTGNLYWGISSSKGNGTLSVEGPDGASYTVTFWVF